MPSGWDVVGQDFRYYLKGIGRADQTIRTYVYVGSLYWRWCAARETDGRDMDKQGLRRWITERAAAVSTARAHNDLAALRLFFKMLKEDGYRDDNPTEGLTVKRGWALPTEPLTVNEYLTMLRVCTNQRDRLIIMLMGYSGLRVSEIAAMNAEDLDWERGYVLVRKGKGSKQRRVAVNPEVMGWLRAWLGMFAEGPVWRSESRATGGERLAINSIRQITYDVARRAGIKDVHPHRFRALYATQMIEMHGDIQALQGQLGHESIETTARYTYYTREQRGLTQSSQLTFSAAVV